MHLTRILRPTLLVVLAIVWADRPLDAQVVRDLGLCAPVARVAQGSLRGAERIAAGRAALEECRQAGPSTALAISEAYLDLLEDRFAEAARAMEGLLAREPDSRHAERLWCQSMARVDGASALPRCRDLAARHPDWAEGHAAVAWLHYNMAQYPEAVSAYEQALALDPRVAAWWNNAGVSWNEQGERSRALEMFRQAQRLDPADPLYPRNIGFTLLLMGGRLDEAVTALDAALDLDPGDAYAWELLGNARLGQGRSESAGDAYDAALALGRNVLSVHNSRGRVHLRAGAYRSALESFRRAAALGPDDDAPVYNQGLVFKELGLCAEAVPYFERTVEMSPEWEPARTELARCRSVLLGASPATCSVERVKALIGLGELALARQPLEACERSLGPNDADRALVASSLAEAMAGGIGGAQNLVRAQLLASEALDKGEAGGALALARAYLDPTPNPARDPIAADWVVRAVKAGICDATILLHEMWSGGRISSLTGGEVLEMAGEMYGEGCGKAAVIYTWEQTLGAPENRDTWEAYKLLTRAAEEDVDVAFWTGVMETEPQSPNLRPMAGTQKILASSLLDDGGRAIAKLTSLRDDPANPAPLRAHARAALGLASWLGLGDVTPDRALAARELEEAVREGGPGIPGSIAHTLEQLAELLQEERAARAVVAEARRWVERGVAAGDPGALLLAYNADPSPARLQSAREAGAAPLLWGQALEELRAFAQTRRRQDGERALATLRRVVEAPHYEFWGDAERRAVATAHMFWASILATGQAPLPGQHEHFLPAAVLGDRALVPPRAAGAALEFRDARGSWQEAADHLYHAYYVLYASEAGYWMGALYERGGQELPRDPESAFGIYLSVYREGMPIGERLWMAADASGVEFSDEDWLWVAEQAFLSVCFPADDEGPAAAASERCQALGRQVAGRLGPLRADEARMRAEVARMGLPPAD